MMGQSARLAVHGVPKVFSKALPPSYLHPSTAGREKIHLVGCPSFLQRNERTCDDGTGDSGISGNGSISTDNNHNHSNKRSAGSPSSSLPSSSSPSSSSSSSKRQKQDHLQPLPPEYGANHTGGHGNLSDGDCACVCACGANSISGSGTGGVVSRGFDVLHDETRLLRFLQTTRININVRQVTATADLGQVTETADDGGDQRKK